MDDNEEYMSDEDAEEFEQYYYEKFGKYDLGDFQDLVRWARDFEPKNPDRMDEVERMGICIRLLSTERMGSNVGYKFMAELCGKEHERAEKAEARAIELETQLAPLQQQFEDWAEQNRRAEARADKVGSEYVRASEHVAGLAKRVEELEENIADAVEDAERFKAENARLRAALDAVAAWLFKLSWEDETYTEIYRNVTQALERKP